jgi:hypothetical protein
LNTRSQIFLYSTILIVDLLFFIIVGQYYPEYFILILDFIPLNNELAAAIIIIVGLIIAIVSALSLFRISLSKIKEVLDNE